MVHQRMQFARAGETTLLMQMLGGQSIQNAYEAYQDCLFPYLKHRRAHEQTQALRTMERFFQMGPLKFNIKPPARKGHHRSAIQGYRVQPGRPWSGSRDNT